MSSHLQSMDTRSGARQVGLHQLVQHLSCLTAATQTDTIYSTVYMCTCIYMFIMTGTLYIVPECVPIQYRARACYLWQEAVMQEEATGRARLTKVTKYSYYLQPDWNRYYGGPPCDHRGVIPSCEHPSAELGGSSAVSAVDERGQETGRQQAGRVVGRGKTEQHEGSRRNLQYTTYMYTWSMYMYMYMYTWSTHRHTDRPTQSTHVDEAAAHQTQG